MYRILTGICCVVWCVAIAFEAFQLDRRQAVAMDDVEFASYFTSEFTEDVTAQIRLCGEAPTFSSEEEITKYLEDAAYVCEIDSGYGIIKRQESYGCVWELAGADEAISYSLKYLRKNDDKNSNLISWQFWGNWSNKMQTIYQKKKTIEAYSQTEAALCLELTGDWKQTLTEEEIEESAKQLLKRANGSLVTVQKQENLQLYYGYVENFGEGIQFQKKNANVNLLYRENGKETRCILGFPAVLWDE